jgi:hypothetical protein
MAFQWILGHSLLLMLRRHIWGEISGSSSSLTATQELPREYGLRHPWFFSAATSALVRRSSRMATQTRWLGRVIATECCLRRERRVLFGGVSAIGAGLVSIGIPKDSVLKYDVALKTDKYVLVVHGTPDEVEKAKDIIAGTEQSHYAVYGQAVLV